MVASALSLGILLTLVAALVVAMRSLFVRLGEDTVHVTHVIYFMILLNAALIVPATAIIFYPTYVISPVSLVAFIGAGLFGSICGRVFHFKSIQMIGASRADPIKASQPIYATILAVLFLDEATTALHLLGIFLIVVGVSILSYVSSNRRYDRTVDPGDAVTIGVVFALTAAFFYALYPVLVRFGLQEGTPLLVGLSITLVANFIGFSVYLYLRDDFPTVRHLSNRWLIMAGCANSVFLLSYFAALSIAPVVVVLPILQVSPLLVIVLSFLFMPRRLELVTWRIAIASAITVAGAVMVSLFG